MDVWKELMIQDEFLFEGSTTEPLLAPWAWSNFIYKDVIQLWKMAVTSSFCFSPCVLELEWFGFSISLQELQRALKTMTLLFWRNQLWMRSMMTKMGQSECPTLVLQSSLPTASFLRAMLQARARAFEIQLRCLFWETKVICQSPTLHGALKQCLPLCVYVFKVFAQKIHSNFVGTTATVWRATSIALQRDECL